MKPEPAQQKNQDSSFKEKNLLNFWQRGHQPQAHTKEYTADPTLFQRYQLQQQHQQKIRDHEENHSMALSTNNPGYEVDSLSGTVS
jgi:hypothetical protein